MAEVDGEPRLLGIGARQVGKALDAGRGGAAFIGGVGEADIVDCGDDVARADQRDTGLFGQGAGWVVDLRVDPANPTRAYAVTNGPAGKNIWFLRQEHKLDTWTNISGDFPANLATATIHVEWQYAPAALYVGTNRAVYHSVNHGQNWFRFGDFLPNTVVTDLQYQASHGILAAGIAEFLRGWVQVALSTEPRR